MFSKSLFVLAAVSSCCYAQQAAADMVTDLDSITQSISDLTVLVKAASTTEETQVCPTEWVSSMNIPANNDSETVATKYRDIIQAENDLNTQEPPTSAFTEDEQTELCGSLKTVSLPLLRWREMQRC